jgi:hypothetical protein
MKIHGIEVTSQMDGLKATAQVEDRLSEHFSLQPKHLYIYTYTLVLPHIYLDVLSWISQGIVFIS